MQAGRREWQQHKKFAAQNGLNNTKSYKQFRQISRKPHMNTMPHKNTHTQPTEECSDERKTSVSTHIAKLIKN